MKISAGVEDLRLVSLTFILPSTFTFFVFFHWFLIFTNALTFQRRGQDAAPDEDGGSDSRLCGHHGEQEPQGVFPASSLTLIEYKHKFNLRQANLSWAAIVTDHTKQRKTSSFMSICKRSLYGKSLKPVFKLNKIY